MKKIKKEQIDRMHELQTKLINMLVLSEKEEVAKQREEIKRILTRIAKIRREREEIEKIIFKNENRLKLANMEYNELCEDLRAVGYEIEI